eukprot:5963461-Prymnesium_polylepis.1
MTNRADEQQWGGAADAWRARAPGEVQAAREWAAALGEALGQSTAAEHTLIRRLTRATTDELREYQTRLNGLHEQVPDEGAR